MLPYVILLIAVLSRVLPHLMHLTGANVSAVGGGLLFFGAALPRSKRWQALLPVVAMAATDYWLTVYAYGYPFHFTSYVITWLWYLGVVLAASSLLHRHRTALRVGAAAMLSSTGFFLLSNGAVWLRGNMYPHTGEGLLTCYTAGLPFYRNDLASTLVFSAVFFALPMAAAALRDAARGASGHGATAA